MAGFTFSETMSGTYRKTGAHEDHPFHFTVNVYAQSLLRHALDKKARLEGRVHMHGIAEDAALDGEIIISPLFGKRIRYEFDFTGDDGQRYRFAGQKDVELSLRRLVETMTVLPGSIVDTAGKEIATATLLFDKRHLPRFLASFRPRW